MNEILLVRDTLHERGAVVLDAARLFSACPSVPVTEVEVARQHRLREGDVSPHHGGFDLLLESQDFGGVAGRVRGGSLRSRRSPCRAVTSAEASLSLGRLACGMRADRQAREDERKEYRRVQSGDESSAQHNLLLQNVAYG